MLTLGVAVEVRRRLICFGGALKVDCGERPVGDVPLPIGLTDP